MDVSARTLAALGFDELRVALAGRCRTEVGRGSARGRPFLESREAVQGALALVEEARRLREEPLTLPLGGLEDVRPFLEQAQRGGMLEPRQLIAVCQCLIAFERTSEMLVERSVALPRLAGLSRRLPLLHRLATRLDRSFEASGEIADRASDGLKEARDRARGLHKRIRGRLDELLHDEAFLVNLRESYYSVRNDRYVVPVLSSHQREVEGIVHNASQSGQTLFVEPKELITLGNELAIAQSVVLEEERKVLLELSGAVGREAGAIEDGLMAAAALDEADACANLAQALGATVPLLESADGAMLLRGLKHPRLLLKGDTVVANDVSLSEGARALVVSGPNAGGKTVTLTGVGLVVLMARAGLPIPCDAGSRVPLFQQVHGAVGDQQDLAQGLSSFSGHVVALKSILELAKPGALVLIDEIAADTDPREGAAIATAVLETLLARGAVALVTTHLEELKALAHVDPRFVNARVGFDPRKMAPTYRLQLGAAGTSSAIDIARRVGLDEEICKRAEELATTSGGALSQAVAAAENERRALDQERETARREVAEAAALKSRLEAELSTHLRRRQEEELKFRSALKAELEYAKSQVRELLTRLEAVKTKSPLEAASGELTSRINEQARAAKEVHQALAGTLASSTQPLRLEPGAQAHHAGVGADVTIVEVAGDAAVVSLGVMKMRVPLSELAPPRGKAPPARFPGEGKKEAQLERAARLAPGQVEAGGARLDLRGQRAEDAIRDVELFLDRLSREGRESGVIVHGHGTGALKATVREHLARSPYVKSWRPGEAGEGGDGATVVNL